MVYRSFPTQPLLSVYRSNRTLVPESVNWESLKADFLMHVGWTLTLTVESGRVENDQVYNLQVKF